MFRKMKTKSGQSTVEYILLATAVIGAMIFFTTGNNSALQGRLGNTLNSATDSIGNISNRLSKSQEGSNTSVDTPPPVGFDPGAGFNQTQ